MTRIIGGAAGGRRIQTPKGDRTRPTSDRVREALFSAIESRCGSLQGLRFLDLYAGSGAVGLEAASRGVAEVVLVESHKQTAMLITENAQSLGLAGVTVRSEPVQVMLAHPPELEFDLVFSDPPYPLTEGDLAADLALLQQWLAPEALVVVERSVRSPEPTWPPGTTADRSKRYGETMLWYGHAVPHEQDESGDRA